MGNFFGSLALAGCQLLCQLTLQFSFSFLFFFLMAQGVPPLAPHRCLFSAVGLPIKFTSAVNHCTNVNGPTSSSNIDFAKTYTHFILKVTFKSVWCSLKISYFPIFFEKEKNKGS